MRNIRRTPTGYQAYVWVKDPTHPKGGFQASRRYGPETTITTMKEWAIKRKLNLPEAIAEAAGGFAQDARDYLRREKVQKMPIVKERERHTEEWIAVFGNRDRKDIQPQEIQKALDALLGRGLAAGSVNKRRTALMDLWTTLDGRHQANPVKATHVYEEPHPEPRAPAMAKVLALLNAMPTKTDYARKCKARARVIAWTGWPHKIVKQIEPGDVDFKLKQAFVNRRRKGKGARARVLPLLPEAVAALKDFTRADAFGHFSNSSFHKRVTAAAKAAKCGALRPYDLRHFFGTLIATITKDERAVQELMLLSTVEQARRYTEAATDPRVQAAVLEVTKHLPRLVKEAGRIGRVSRVGVSASGSTRPHSRTKTGRKTSKVGGR